MKLKIQHNNSELIYKARNFAFEAHAKEKQRYGNYDYSKHLSDVFIHLVNYGFNSFEYLTTALLHDVLEDTYVSQSEIKNLFGQEVLNNVVALTKLSNGEPNYELLNKCPIAKAVKLADSTCNLGQGLVEKNTKSEKYIKRFPEYREKLYVVGEYENLWNAMQERILIYKTLVLN